MSCSVFLSYSFKNKATAEAVSPVVGSTPAIRRWDNIRRIGGVVSDSIFKPLTRFEAGWSLLKDRGGA